MCSVALLREHKARAGTGDGGEPQHAAAARDSGVHLGAGQQLVRWINKGPWAQIKDQASQQLYFWHSASNEVAWELPTNVQQAADAEMGAKDAPGVASHADGAAKVEVEDKGEAEPQAQSAGAREATDGQHVESALAASASEQAGTAEPPAQTSLQAVAAAEAVSLPEGWKAVEDEESGDVYFWHPATGATQWERPAAAASGNAKPSTAADSAVDADKQRAELAAAAEPAAAGDGADVPIDASEQPEVVTEQVQRSTAGASSAAVGVQAEVLTQSLPSGWRQTVDDDSGDTYYWNVSTGETSWELPIAHVTAAAAAAPAAPDPSSSGGATEQQDAEAMMPDVAEVKRRAPEAAAQPAVPPAPMRAHARASAAVAAAISSACGDGSLRALLPSCPRLLLVHAQLQVRQQDLAALRTALRSSQSDPAHRSAIAHACEHIAAEVDELAQQLPAARADAAAVVAASALEDGEVQDAEPTAEAVAGADKATFGTAATRSVNADNNTSSDEHQGHSSPDVLEGEQDGSPPPLPTSPSAASEPPPLPSEGDASGHLQGATEPVSTAGHDRLQVRHAHCDSLRSGMHCMQTHICAWPPNVDPCARGSTLFRPASSHAQKPVPDLWFQSAG